jgi:hypothetical protein
VTETGFGLVIRLINHSQKVTTINYNTVSDFYTTKHSTLTFSVYFHCSSRIYHTGTIQGRLHHALPISLYYSTHKVFTSHVKSSQADLLFSSVLLVPIRSLVRVLLPRLLFTRNWTKTVTAFTSHLELNWTLWNIISVALYRLRTDHAQKTRLYCCIRNIAQWTSHMTPSQYCWSVTSGACVEVCLLGRKLETNRVTPLFHCWYVYYLETADSVAQPFLHGANTA